MTEISQENAYFVVSNGYKPGKPLEDEYHWVTPAVGPKESSVVPKVPETKISGYDCTQPKSSPI